MEEVEQQSKLCRRLLLFPAPFQGHVNPMLHLATLLHSNGFSITIIQAPYNPVNPTQFPHFTFRLLENSLLESYSKSPPTDTFTIISAMNDSCSDTFRDCLSQLLDEDQEPIAALIIDPLWSFVGSVAASFNLPRIVLRTGSMSALLVYCSLPSLKEKGYLPPQGVVADELNLPRLALRTGGLLASVLYDSLPLLQEKGYFPLQETQSEEPVLEVPPLKVKDLPPEVHHNVLLNMVKETKNNCQGIICNTFKDIEGSILERVHGNFLATPIYLIGPLHKISPTDMRNIVTQEQSSITWLNKQAPNSVLYVSFGTLAAISKEQFLEVAWGLANSQQPFLWVTRPKLINGSEKNDDLFPENFLENVSGRGHIVTWAPQQQILAHPAVGGFWTHCGWNSTIESICEGVPMICLPFFGDQKMNARHISDVLKIGLQLEKNLERQDIEKVIRRLMVEEEGQEMRERITSLKQKADRCLNRGKSTYKSLDRLTRHILSFCGAEKMKS